MSKSTCMCRYLHYRWSDCADANVQGSWEKETAPSQSEQVRCSRGILKRLLKSESGVRKVSGNSREVQMKYKVRSEIEDAMLCTYGRDRERMKENIMHRYKINGINQPNISFYTYPQNCGARAQQWRTAKCGTASNTY